MGHPVTSLGYPYQAPHVVDPICCGTDAISTECAEIGHAYAVRTGDEGMGHPVGSRRYPYHLPRVVDPGSAANISTECAEVGHAYTVGAGDEGMALPAISPGYPGYPYHPPGVVDPVSGAKVSTECAKGSRFLAVKVNEKSVLLGEHGRCEPDTQDCGQDKVAQFAAVVNVHQTSEKECLK
jgi:hypothetical protein